jgi:hypothetical protein
MGWYDPKSRSFLDKQMTGGAMQGLLEAKQDGAQKAAKKFNKVGASRHYAYVVVEESYIDSTYWGGPRIAMRYGVVGEYVFALEFGSETWDDTNRTYGSLRRNYKISTRGATKNKTNSSWGWRD